MVKAVILDVDGVVVGKKIGFNSPSPHKKVIEVLKKLKNNNIPVVLCTAKPHFAITEIIKDARLDNIHIADGGGVIINPLKNKIIEEFVIPKDLASKAIEGFLKNNIYTEFYTTNEYVIQESQTSEITEGHSKVLQSHPRKVNDLVEASNLENITKIMPVALDEEDKVKVQEVFDNMNLELVMSWGVHPRILPLQFGIVTAPGISKKKGAELAIKSLEIEFKEVLGVGDSTSDWQFIEMCGYGGAMGNAKEELKELVKTKGDNGYIGGDVDENGLLDIFEKFEIGK